MGETTRLLEDMGIKPLKSLRVGDVARGLDFAIATDGRESEGFVAQQAEGPPGSPSAGFKGAVAGLGLSDVLQLKAQNRFSGCITVEHGQTKGLLFFRDGEIIHAEHGEQIGEQALYEMLAWQDGRFSVQPNVSTTRKSIDKSLRHLLLEGHQILDEQRATRIDPPSAAQEPPAVPPPMRFIDRLRGIPGLAYAVVQGRDGAPVGDDSYQAEVLAGQAGYLSMLGNQLGAIFGVKELRFASVHGASRQLLLFSTKTQYLSVLVRSENEIGAVEAEIRRILGAKQ
jgi:predicted regulator of Ras-like GTPase activity (Roadblock/LC7/MglB family)